MVAFYPWVIDDFYIQFFIAEMLILVELPKRNGFVKNAILLFLGFATIAYVSLSLFMWIDFMWGYFLLLLLLGIGIGMLLVSVSLQDMIFLSLVAYTMQNVAYHITRILFLILQISDTAWYHPWLTILSFALTYMGIAYFLIRRTDTAQLLGVPKAYIISLSVIVLTLEYALNITAFRRGENGSLLLIALLACAVLTMLLQFNIFSNNKLTKEYEDIHRLLEKEKDQYRQAKENIELINMKCHDIKHQISVMRADPANAFTADAEKVIDIYESTARTGNEALDVILTEKNLYCTQNNIQLVYMADGEKLNFIRPTDIYSLFGNALSNAIECVDKEPDFEKRLITMDIHAKDRLLLISIENYTSSEESFRDIIPTTQKDRNYHGYGLKSIRYITEQYGGRMNISQQDHYFNLTILFPL